MERARRLGHRPGDFTVQRLAYLNDDRKLHAPSAYGDLEIPWDETNKVTKPGSPKKTLAWLYQYHRDLVLGWLKEALTADQDLTVDGLELHEPGDINQWAFENLAGDPQARQTSLQTLKAMDRFWVAYSKNFGSDPPDTHHMLLPKDFVPGASDLEDEGVNVTERPTRHKQNTTWTKVCTLIAIAKAEDGFDRIKSKTNEQSISELDEAVQALHDHYRSQDPAIEYDDTSSHPKLMAEWGYSLVFTGPASWRDLHTSLPMKKDDTFIVDIDTHTVMMTVKKTPPKAHLPMADPKQYYEFHSEKDNYNKDELDESVQYVYKKK